MTETIRTPRDVTADGPPFVIRRDGTWLHGDVPIARTALARLFATILFRRDDGTYWLQNPAEVCHVTVDDTPYVAGKLSVDGSGNLHITTTLDETFPIDAAHPLTMQNGVPHVTVRNGCATRLTPQLLYALAERAEVAGGQAWITSFGAKFSLGAI